MCTWAAPVKLGLLIKIAHETRIEKGDPKGSWREALMADRDDQYTFNKCMRLSKSKKYNFKKKRIKRNQNSNQIIPNQKEFGYVILSRKVPKQNYTGCVVVCTVTLTTFLLVPFLCVLKCVCLVLWTGSLTRDGAHL